MELAGSASILATDLLVASDLSWRRRCTMRSILTLLRTCAREPLSSLCPASHCSVSSFIVAQADGGRKSREQWASKARWRALRMSVAFRHCSVTACRLANSLALRHASTDAARSKRPAKKKARIEAPTSTPASNEQPAGPTEANRRRKYTLEERLRYHEARRDETKNVEKWIEGQAHRSNPAGVLQGLRRLQNRGVRLTSTHYQLLLATLASRGMANEALDALQDMRSVGIPPDVDCYGSAVKASKTVPVI